MVHLYPCQCPEGHYLNDYPSAEIDVPKDEAEALLASKAFSATPDGLHPPDETEPPQPESPPEGGLTDSGA